MVYSWTIHGYEFQESNILNHELLMNSSWIVHGSANRFYTMNSSWFTHEQFMVMNFRKAGLNTDFCLWRSDITTGKYIFKALTIIHCRGPDTDHSYTNHS